MGVNSRLRKLSNGYIYTQLFRTKSQKWGTPLDKSDQTTENGMLFADARDGTSGGTATTAPSGTIPELLVSDYLDPDAPDPALYPKGMLLWNLRRSGFNVKRFERNYIDTNADNTRFKVDNGRPRYGYILSKSLGY